ncbi:MAG: alpha/beta fold hydrolase, partial [Micromonosporaceae bacterium]
VAPRTDTERAVARTWAEVLKLEQVGALDNFFDLGGNSLDLVRLGRALRTTFSVELDPRSLYATPTVAAMAAAVDSHHEATINTSVPRSEVSPLAPITVTGTAAPLFFVHAVGGSVVPYLRLASLLGADQPFYGLEDPALRGGAPMSSVADAAARYVAAIREVQPAGPYHLGGWSLGGAIAVEMARQLHAKGESTPLVVAIDSGMPTPYQAEPVEFLEWFAGDLAGIVGTPPPPLDRAELRGLTEAEQVEKVLSDLEAAGLARPELRDELRTRITVFTANTQAYFNHRPAPYHGRLVFLSAAEQPDGQPDTYTAEWRALAPAGFEHQVLPGNHYTMLQPPQLQRLAAVVKRYLTETGR